MSDNAFYFGCWREAGHYLFTPSGRSTYSVPNDFPLPANYLDSGLLPPNLPETEGRASLVHINGWTVISFWDRSVDKRGKCNSSFLFRGHFTFDEMCKLAAEKFPTIWNRFAFPITEHK